MLTLWCLHHREVQSHVIIGQETATEALNKLTALSSGIEAAV